MKTFILLGLLVPFLVHSASRNDDKVQAVINGLIRENASKQLQLTTAQYNENRDQNSELLDLAKQAGIKDHDQAQLAIYARGAGQLPRAEWKNGKVVLEGGGHTIEIGTADYWNHTMQIDGETFEWNWKESVAQNLKRYDAAFKTTSGAWNLLVDTAWADDVLSLKASGIQFYFRITTVGQIDQRLIRLNEQVQKLVADCKAENADPKKTNAFSNATMQSVIDTGFERDLIPLRTCNSVKAFAADKQMKLPKDLCQNLGLMAKCMRDLKTMPHTPPSDLDWQDVPGSSSAQ